MYISSHEAHQVFGVGLTRCKKLYIDGTGISLKQFREIRTRGVPSLFNKYCLFSKLRPTAMQSYAWLSITASCTQGQLIVWQSAGYPSTGTTRLFTRATVYLSPLSNSTKDWVNLKRIFFHWHNILKLRWIITLVITGSGDGIIRCFDAKSGKYVAKSSKLCHIITWSKWHRPLVEDLFWPWGCNHLYSDIRGENLLDDNRQHGQSFQH